MDQNLLKTSWKQRAVIIIIALLMIFSFVATYIAIILSNKSSDSTSSTDNAEFQAIQEEYQAKSDEINEYATTLSSKYYDTLNSFKSRVKSYNATTANSEGLKTTDLKEGDGRELKADDKDYLAYYIGWCADETIFDSSFDNKDNPTSLIAPISASAGLIEGWNQGVIGMKLNGVREITIPGELAYGETQEICGGKNSPIKFVVLAFTDDKMKKLADEADEIMSRLYTAYYGSGN
ncbi:FKBP-type peptidyl-prolyl cis-trans isomerase [Candidatus Saccharibacteria bacterium]|nr:FKBP-type peptidyl-prolyl cis-trans isomerase [Candidatus Saccharibacteria bacterium]